MGRKAGVTQAKINALEDFERSPEFSEIEKMVLSYSVQMTKTPVEMDDRLFRQLREHFNEKQIVELTSAIAWENYRARFNHALEIESAGFCRLPPRS